MITEIRNSLKSGGFKIVLWIILLAMIVVYIPNIFKRGGEGHYAIIATINNKDINLMDFERRVHQENERVSLFRQQLGAQAESILHALGISDPKTMALNGLIQEALLSSVAEKLNLHISPDFITEKLNNPSYIMEELSDVIPYFVIDQQGINNAMVDRYLAQNRLSMQDFDAKIEDKIKRNIVLEIAGSTAYVTNQQMKDYFINNYLGKEYMIVTFPFSLYLKKAKTNILTEKERAEFFDKSRKTYWTPEKRSGSMWKFSPKDYGIEISNSDVESYYTSHKSQFLETPLQVQVRRILFKVANDDEKSVDEAQKKATKVKAELAKNSSDFERLAREYSDDKKSALKGGIIDFFKKGEMDSEFERVAFRLQNDGDVSDIIPTQEGLEIIQRVARKPATYKPLDAVKNNIKNLVNEQKFKTKFTDDVSKLLSKYSKEQLSTAIKEFAQSKHAQLEKIENITNDGTPLAEKLFKSKQDEWTSLMVQGNGVIATISSIEKSHKPEFESVKKQVEQDAYKDKALDLIKKDLDEAQNLNFDSIQQRYPGVSIKKTGMIKKDDKEKLSEFSKQGLPVSTFESLEGVGNTTTVMHENNGYLVKVTALESFNQDLYDGNKNIIAHILYDEQKQLAQRGFIASLYRNATINLTKELLTMKDENSL